ncbi:hypothetical protein HQ585_19925 [candidate division KSB1 bacterium]|nr:hypothetical protein [candidate division KSB1 bacterium]
MEKLIRKTVGEKLHFLIFERVTEEESVLTIATLLTSLGHEVSIFISQKIDTLIHNCLSHIRIEPVILPDELSNALYIVDDFINKNPIDLIFFTRYRADSFHEYRLYKNFVTKHQVCSLIDGYERWLKNLPPIKFNGWKIVQRSPILDWLFCKLIANSFSCYFVSEPHVESENPLKLLVQSRLNRYVFDLPFKVMQQEYNPVVNNEIIHFVIPGAVDKSRRDYFLVIKLLTSKELIHKKWKLILLGRPIGNYGEKVVCFCKEINKRLKYEKIIIFDHYISKTLFNKYMLLSDFIIAPIIPSKYKYGKDSGALYDVFLYNKIGIINDRYFYHSQLIEKEILLKYRNKAELRTILISIINKRFDVNQINKRLDKINLVFGIGSYMCFLKSSINSVFSIDNK